MATGVQRSGLGFERFFRRRSSSPEPAKDTDEDEDSPKGANESGLSRVGKFFGQKSADDKDDPSDDPRSASTKANDEAASQKTEGSKKSSKKKKLATKQEDKREDAEACKELVIKDDVGQVKLTEIINNSIKEAVLNIVKEGVCPLADSLERTKDPDRKATPSSLGQEAQDKENKPGSPKNLASLVSGANKTFDSHLCQSQRQPASSSRNPYKPTAYDQVTVNQCTRESCQHSGNDRKSKKSKQIDKILREGSPNISRPTKGSSHFRTDNRRMTGNVNIYICSEANENAKDKKHKKDKNQCNDESETTSETKTCTSSLSVSTSKLVAALRKKQRKNLEDQPPNCLCDIPESSTNRIRSASKIADDGDDVSCLCDEASGHAEFLDTGSSSSRDAVCEDGKFSDLDFAARSDLGSDRACTSQDCGALSASASDHLTSYDNNDFWPGATEDFSSYEDEYRETIFEREQSGDANDLDEPCPCCNLKRCRKIRPSTVPCRQEPRDRICKTQVNRCPCIVEEEDEDCCIDGKEPVETFTVCGNADPKEENFEKIALESSSGILKGKKQPGSPKSDRTLQIASTSSEKILNKKDEPNIGDADTEPTRPESPKKGLFSTFKKNRKKSADRESKMVSGETSKKGGEEERVTEIAEASKEDNAKALPVTDDRRNGSFFYRSIKRAMGMVSTRKGEEAAGTEKNKDSELARPELLAETESSGKDEASGAAKGVDGPSGRVIEKGRITSGVTSSPRKRSRSRISTAIASRRSSASKSNESSNLSIPYCQTDPPTSGSPTNLAACQSDRKPVDTNKIPKDCKCQRVSENCECRCTKFETPEDESCKRYTKCIKVSSCSSICSKTIETPKTKPSSCCPTCGNLVDCCVCCRRKTDTIVEDQCNCCPRCRRPMAECKCRCGEPEVAAEEFCDCCRRSKHLCCCEENSRGKILRSKKCRQPSDFKETNRCNRRCQDRDERCPKSMICIYCDNPQEDCTCRAPIRKCSQCGLPLDVCNCKTPTCCDCSGRLIVPTEGRNEQTICVTAWKPRRSVRKYFARETDDEDFEEDCPCYDKSKPYGSDVLPYQKRGAFSTVMTELQQKISGSVCCNVCGKVPCCCCCTKNERGSGERAKTPRLSTIAERRIPCPSKERSRSKSPAESCTCTPIPQRKRGRKLALRFCDRCRTSPCRCRRRSSTSPPQRKPQARCYYCKNSPCIKERGSTRKRASMERNAASKECNGCRGRVVVPASGSQKIRKYCCIENPTNQRATLPDDRVG